MNNLTPIPIITDKPDESPTSAFETLADKIAGIIIQSKPNFTIGIHGDWGTGKTTLMKCIQKKFQTVNPDQEWVPTTWFNAWRYERESDKATIPLILTILERLFQEVEKEKQNQSWFRGFKERVKKCVKNLSFNLSIPIVFASLDISSDSEESDGRKITKPNIQEGLDLIQELTQQIKAQHTQGVKLVVFLDDLDRCSPTKTVEVLESIKILLDIEGLVYVLGVSHNTIHRLITAAYEKSDIKGKEYLKKIIQIPIYIPSWQPKDFEEIMNKEIKKVLDPKHFEILKGNEELIVTAVKGNPRELKRFINSLILATEIYGDREGIKGEEFLVVEIMKLVWHDFFELFSMNQEFRNMLSEYFQGDKKLFELLDGIRKKAENQTLSRFEKQILEVDEGLWDFLRQTHKTFFGIDKWESYRSISAKLTQEPSETGTDSLDRDNLVLLLRNGLIDKFNSIREKSNMQRIDLRGIGLGHTKIENANLSNAVLINSDFSFAVLTNVKFQGSWLGNVYFRETILEEIDFSDADLKGANFRNSRMRDVNFSGSDLRGAKFENVWGDNVITTKSTKLGDTKLENIKKLP